VVAFSFIIITIIEALASVPTNRKSIALPQACMHSLPTTSPKLRALGLTPTHTAAHDAALS